MDKLKACPFCGKELVYFGKDRWDGKIQDCYKHPLPEGGEFSCTLTGLIFPINKWNRRPIEDALRAENERLATLLRDEISQIEIATDLSNKRWVALNDIYKNGEIHNVNWCKRRAAMAIGIGSENA